MKFTVINEGFQCGNCGTEIPPHPEGSCRNHCSECLYSKHMDFEYPGDRNSTCLGQMPPVALDYTGKKNWMLIHECKLCGTRSKNKIAPDDKTDLLPYLSGK